MRFDYETLPTRVLFGSGRLNEVQSEAVALNGDKALVLSGQSQMIPANKLCNLLGEMCVGIRANALPHVPYTTIASVLDEVKSSKVNLLIAVGGGSTIGLAKGIALETSLPILAIPTTFAGSEMTRIWGISRDGRKTTGRNVIVKPKTVIYDPELLLPLPTAVSLTSGINAMAHAVEALYAENANPIAMIMAEESIRYIGRDLSGVVTRPGNISFLSNVLYGAWLAGSVLDMVGMALHHKLCHTLGGSFNMPHAATHTVILPYVVRFNAPAIPAALAVMARALQCQIDNVPEVIQDLSKGNGGPISLQELGFAHRDLQKAAEIAAEKPYYNPRPVTVSSLLDILRKAFLGERP